jgi:hypothetical protein
LIGSAWPVASENQAGRGPVSKSRTLLPAGMRTPLIADGAGLTVPVTGRPGGRGRLPAPEPAITVAAAPAATMSKAVPAASQRRR